MSVWSGFCGVSLLGLAFVACGFLWEAKNSAGTTGFLIGSGASIFTGLFGADSAWGNFKQYTKNKKELETIESSLKDIPGKQKILADFNFFEKYDKKAE